MLDGVWWRISWVIRLVGTKRWCQSWRKAWLKHLVVVIGQEIVPYLVDEILVDGVSRISRFGSQIYNWILAGIQKVILWLLFFLEKVVNRSFFKRNYYMFHLYLSVGPSRPCMIKFTLLFILILFIHLLLSLGSFELSNHFLLFFSNISRLWKTSFFSLIEKTCVFSFFGFVKIVFIISFYRPS